MTIHLNNKALLAITGAGADDFLQTIITQDLSKLSKETVLFSAHLTAQGKFLYDFFVIALTEGQIALMCEKATLMNLAKSLHGFSIGKKVEFHDLSDDYEIYADIDDVKSTAGTVINRSENSLTFSDPRHKDMGTVTLRKNDTKHENFSPKTTDIAAELPFSSSNGKNINGYTKKRISLCIPDGYMDTISERTLINELYFEQLNGVSFDKGCYVGQELTARTKFRTEPKKRLFKLVSKTEITAENGDILTGNDGENIGHIFSHNTNEAIAICRTRYVENGKEFKANNHTFTAHSPSWI